MAWRPKRFYAEVACASERGLHRILLDRRPARTPAGKPLELPTAGLAAAIAAEWRAQEGVIDLQTMPLTQLAATALDRIAPRRTEVIAALIGYSGSDLLCYWASHPPDLVARQQQLWAPLLHWAERRWGIRLAVVSGVMPVEQPAVVGEAVRAAIAPLSDVKLTALSSAVDTSGSLVVGLALVDGRIDAEEAFAAAFVDELYQAERWGEDKEASLRRRRLRADLRAADAFLALSGEAARRSPIDQLREEDDG